MHPSVYGLKPSLKAASEWEHQSGQLWRRGGGNRERKRKGFLEEKEIKVQFRDVCLHSVSIALKGNIIKALCQVGEPYS